MALRSVLENRTMSVSIAIAIICLGLFLARILDTNITQARLYEAQQETNEDAYDIVRAIERRIAFHEFVSVAISTAVLLDPDLDQETFASLAQPLIKNHPGVTNLALETEYTITHVYPYASNKFILGLDYRDSATFGPAIEKIRQTNAPDLSGPFSLLQGFDGVIYRYPIKFGDVGDIQTRRQGSIAIVSSVASLLALAEQTSGNVRVAIEFGGADGSISENRFGAKITEQDAPIIRTTEVAGKSITIYVTPREGWGSTSEINYGVYVLALILVGTLLGFLFWAQRLLKSRRESWQQLSQAIEAIDDGFALFDPDDRLVLCNSRYKAFYNRSAHLIVPGAKFSDIIWGGAQLGQYKDAIGREQEWFEERMEAHRNPVKSIVQLLDDDRWLKVSEAKLEDGSRVGFRVDITTLKRAQNEAESANQAKTDFLNVMSHEIRTPLSAIIGFSKVLKSAHRLPAVKALVEEAAAENSATKRRFEAILSHFENYAERIDVNGQHLLNIINDILYLNDFDKADKPLNLTAVPISDIIQTTVQQLSGLADEKGLYLHAATTDVLVHGDPVKLQQVLVNLVGNAIKFTDAGGVRIRFREADEFVQISIEDTGCGIPANQHGKIFESFFQVDSGLNRRFDGSGLGLTISKDIIEKHHGSIRVESVAGQGSVFHILLPKERASDLAA